MSLLQLNLSSFTDLRRPGALTEIGQALDADPQLRPERIDLRDPIRNKVTSATEYFVGQERGSDTPDWFLFEHRRDPHYYGELHAPSYRIAKLRDSPHELSLVTTEEDEPWCRDLEHIEAFAQLFVRLAGAFDAAYGFATDNVMWRQQGAGMTRGWQQGDPEPPVPGPFTDRYALRDVYWLNYYGPAFIERWGERLSGLGVRQERTPNGGIVIWATDTPFMYREDVGSFMDYPWKQPFYEALGRDTFVHPLQPPGQYVPTREDHLRHVRTEAVDTTQPRPEPAPSAAGASVSEPAAPAWLVQKVAELRRLGFFATYDGDETAAAELASDYRAEWGRDSEAGEEHLELLLAQFDAARVWWEDTEADVAAGNDVYVSALAGWARISRGAFAPSEIREEWLGEEGPVLLHLRLGGREHTLTPRYLDDYLDTEILSQVNALLEPSLYRLRMHTAFDQTAFVVAVDDAERGALEQRGWSFAK